MDATPVNAWHVTTASDPLWAQTIARRRAVLWVGRSHQIDRFPLTDNLQQWISNSWHSVYLPTGVAAAANHEIATPDELLPIRLKAVPGDPDDTPLQDNRVPVYLLPPPSDTDPSAILARLKACKRVPQASTVFAIVRNYDEDLAELKQTLQLVGPVTELVLICEETEPPLLPARRLVHLQVSESCFAAFLAGVRRPSDTLRRQAEILVASPEGPAIPIDLSAAVDHGYSILKRFELIPAADALDDGEPTPAVLESFLDSPEKSWLPYARGVPFDRTADYLPAVRGAVKDCRKKGPVFSTTVWIDAEQASGATTVLRSLAMSLARDGIPVLVALPDTSGFDFQQIASFLRTSVRILDESEAKAGDVPWVIAFDVPHTVNATEFVANLAIGMRRLERSVVVVALRPTSWVGASKLPLSGRQRGSRRLKISNRLEASQISALGEHLNGILLPAARRSLAEWSLYMQESLRSTATGVDSFFWIALRFWLKRAVHGESLVEWLARQLASIATDTATLTAMAEVATFSKYSLRMPSRVLDKGARESARNLVAAEDHPFGFREIWTPTFVSYAYPHPLIAEELLRIIASDERLLGRLEIEAVASAFDLELAMFGRILPRHGVAFPEAVSEVEELATTALRVDPREAPRNYASRARIVALLESVPDELFETSSVFLHHLAKARRHLAVDPPRSPEWESAPAVREQLELAQEHLQEALNLGRMASHMKSGRAESELNLRVSLALTLQYRARFEGEHDDDDGAARFANEADKQFEAAHGLDPDSSYVLENFARFKIHRARELPAEERIGWLVEAVSLLETQRAGEHGTARAYPNFELLASAYDQLQDDVGMERLQALADKGSEAATVALVRLALETARGEVDADGIEALLKALGDVPVSNRTWRSLSLTYQLYSQWDPWDFEKRLEVLKQLETSDEYPWPLQLRQDFGTLLYQMGERRSGREVFEGLRNRRSSVSGSVIIRDELRFIMDPTKHFREILRTSLRVSNTSSAGRSYYGIPFGWEVDVPFRPYLFSRDVVREGDELDCVIQFTSMGPLAVPVTEA